MKERPMLFSAPMVRALLAGTKTQTRRVVKDRHIDAAPPVHFYRWLRENSPYGQPGDRLWVREAHWIDRRDPQCAVMDLDGYVVDDHPLGKSGIFVEDMAGLRANTFWRKRPSIHMPRWASRILLEIISVRVERLNDISEADAEAEGIETVQVSETDFRYVDYLRRTDQTLSDKEATRGNPVMSYATLWESINGPGSWDANPFVWVIEFKRVTP